MTVVQLDLLTMARTSDPGPSHAAAAMVAPKAPSARQRVLDVVTKLHEGAHLGATADEVAGYLEVTGRAMQRNSVSKRLGELTSAGRLVVAEYRRKSPAGVPVTVYLPAGGAS